MGYLPPREERTYEDSLRVDFKVVVEQYLGEPGRGSLSRTDGVNWNIMGIDYHPSSNCSGPDAGPSQLVSKAQAEAYMQHIAYLWNKHVDELRAKEAASA